MGAGDLVLVCEWPVLDGSATAAAHLHVVGWAGCRSGVAEVTVSIAGRHLTPRIGLPRMDLEAELGRVQAEISGFAMVLDLSDLRPRLYELGIEARGRDGERARTGGVVEIGPDVSYRAWRRLRRAEEMHPPPLSATALIVHVVAVESGVAPTERLLAAQSHKSWWWADGTLADVLRLACRENAPLVVVDGQGRLAPNALGYLAAEFDSRPQSDLVYADEDAVTADGQRGDAFFKPGWSPELVLELDYVGPLIALSPRACAKVLEHDTPTNNYELVLALLDTSLTVRRIPRVLFTSSEPRAPADTPTVRDAIERAAARRARPVRITPGRSPGTRRVSWPITDQPLVSVILPTSASHTLLDRCLASLAERTTYARVELVVVDSSPAGLGSPLDAAQPLPHRVVPYRGPFNFSTAVNVGAEAAAGEVLVLLNDDTEIVSPDWIERMLEHLQIDGVGVVGAKLLLPDDLIQHAGVVVDVDAPAAQHVLSPIPGDAPGYRGMLWLVRNCTAVTGACMMIRRSLFGELGGFDEALAIDFGDIDFCLRAGERGARVVWTPHSVLIHHERSSLPWRTHTPDHVRFRRRWNGSFAEGDPYYHPEFVAMPYELPDASTILRQMSPAASDQTVGVEPFDPPPPTLDAARAAIEKGEIAMWCERPVFDGSAVAESFLTIEGWAHSAAALDGVFVYVDGLRYRARLGVFRGDVRELLGPDAARSGFYLTIELGERQVGLLEVAVVARGSAGAVGVRGMVDCLPAPAPAEPLSVPGPDPSAVDPFGAVERFVPEDARGTMIEVEHQARYRWALPAVRGRRVLDAGCGVGYGTALMTESGAAQAIGVDISRDAIRQAHDQFGHRGGFVVADLAELPFADDFFDVVICFEAIEHVEDPERVLDELRRVLDDDGFILLSTPNRSVYPPGNPFHVHEYLPDEFEQALARRFDHVRLYAQRSHYSTSIISADGLSGTLPLQTLDSGMDAPELYTLAVAASQKLPEIDELMLMGGVFEGRSWHDLAWSWQERILLAEAAATASDTEAEAARRESARSLELLQIAEREHRRATTPPWTTVPLQSEVRSALRILARVVRPALAATTKRLRRLRR